MHILSTECQPHARGGWGDCKRDLVTPRPSPISSFPFQAIAPNFRLGQLRHRSALQNCQFGGEGGRRRGEGGDVRNCFLLLLNFCRLCSMLLLNFCRLLQQRSTALRELPGSCLDQLLQRLQAAGQCRDDITRRSAGLPFALIAIFVAGHPGSPKVPPNFAPIVSQLVKNITVLQ